MKNTINFSEDGTNFVINFADGSESMVFVSIETGFKAINDLFKDDKITKKEHSEMKEQILGAKNIPWSELKKESKIIIFEMLGVGANKGPVEVASFDMCTCGIHGNIITKKCSTSHFFEKKHALNAVEVLKNETKFISEKEYHKVKKEIEESTLAD